MEKPTLYRKQAISNISDRETSPLTSEENAQVVSIVTRFFELFKAKHL